MIINYMQLSSFLKEALNKYRIFLIRLSGESRNPVEDVFLLDPDFHRDDGGGWAPARVYARSDSLRRTGTHTGINSGQYPLPLPGEGTTAWMQEVEQRREHLPRRGYKAYWMFCYYGIMLLLLLSPAAFAGDLGRLFTTPQERAALEKLRNQKPVQKIEPEIVMEETETEPAAEQPEIGGITVHGLVYRNGGKSTAWVNSGNTYEGDLGNQYLQIDAGNIKPEDVVIEIPITDTTLSLKAGETFSPESEESVEPDYNHQ